MSEQIQHMQRLQLAGTLARGIAHDLNNQLTLVLGHLELALDRVPEGYDAHAWLENAIAAASRCATLGRRLLFFGREGGPVMTRVNVAAAVQEAQQMLECVKPPRIRIVSDCETGLFMEGDDRQVQQAVINLGLNAFDAMPQGGELLIRAYPENDRVCIMVRDTGCGIPSSQHKRIFEPFFTTHAETGGSGLGLATVQSIATSFDGVIHLESEPGSGSTFTLDFPALVAEVPDPEPEVGELLKLTDH